MNLHSSLSVRDLFSHPYETKCANINLHKQVITKCFSRFYFLISDLPFFKNAGNSPRLQFLLVDVLNMSIKRWGRETNADSSINGAKRGSHSALTLTMFTEPNWSPITVQSACPIWCLRRQQQNAWLPTSCAVLRAKGHVSVFLQRLWSHFT
jgi:hypothetical protein